MRTIEGKLRLRFIITRSIEKGERIAQLVVTPFLAVDYVESDTLSDTSRGEGGFGSTGKL